MWICQPESTTSQVLIFPCKELNCCPQCDLLFLDLELFSPVSDPTSWLRQTQSKYLCQIAVRRRSIALSHVAEDL